MEVVVQNEKYVIWLFMKGELGDWIKFIYISNQ